MSGSAQSTFLNLDDAWGPLPFSIPSQDMRDWGPRLRYIGTRADVEAFWESVKGDLGPFVLYGSGDFHYLAGVFLRRVTTPLTLISFDNHPDWDIRPPRWACGGWINRALELPHVKRAVVWGCGNFELALPSRIFANHRALRSGRLEVHPWAQRMAHSVCRRFPCIKHENWRDRFEQFADSLAGEAIYITIDLDCLRTEDAVTNWENGLFTTADLSWAIRQLRTHARLVGADVCGAFSLPRYARAFQRFAGWWDHPRMPAMDIISGRETNQRTLRSLWPALTAGD